MVRRIYDTQGQQRFRRKIITKNNFHLVTDNRCTTLRHFRGGYRNANGPKKTTTIAIVVKLKRTLYPKTKNAFNNCTRQFVLSPPLLPYSFTRRHSRKTINQPMIEFVVYRGILDWYVRAVTVCYNNQSVRVTVDGHFLPLNARYCVRVFVGLSFIRNYCSLLCSIFTSSVVNEAVLLRNDRESRTSGGEFDICVTRRFGEIRTVRFEFRNTERVEGNSFSL